MYNRIALYIQEYIDGKRRALPVLALLTFCSWVWGFVSWVRSTLWKVLPQKRLPIPVISIGALVAGGSGKTPFVLKLAGELAPFLKVAILTRGYRGGDEAALLRKRCPAALVLEGKNRYEQGLQAVQQGA